MSEAHEDSEAHPFDDKENNINNNNSKEEGEDEEEKRRVKLKRLVSIASATTAFLLVGCYLYDKKRRRRRRRRNESLLVSSILSCVSSLQQHRRKKKEGPFGAEEAPLSVLLSGASEGRVEKAMLNGSSVLYNILISSNNNNNNNKSKFVWRKSSIPSDSPSIQSSVLEALTAGGCNDISTLPESLLSKLAGPATASIPFIYLALLYLMLRRLQRHQVDNGDDQGSIIQRRNNLAQHKTTFKDVAGIDNVKIELKEIVSYLQNPHKYTTLGANIPRGVLLYGPPGSGKTLLAKALAGEANVDAFVSCTGSHFVEMYVGRGAARVRDLFAKIKRDATNNYVARLRKQHQQRQHSSLWNVYHQIQDTFHSFIFGNDNHNQNHHPFQQQQQQVLHTNPTAVVFIDEIDALAKKRGGDHYNNSFLSTSNSGGSDEREQTLNQLLSEMDGFDTSSSSSSSHHHINNDVINTTKQQQQQQVTVIVVAATNRPDVLDPALLRPGRFDRHVHVHYPDAKGRKQILLVHSRRIKLLQDNHDNNNNNNVVDFNRLAADDITGNFSGADLSNLINEAAFLAVRDGCTVVTQKHLMEAAKKVARMKKSAHYRGP